MKKLIFTAALLISCAAFQISNAQVRFHVNLNIGSQPEWGPTGYDHVDYYYMPDVDSYYDVSTHQYIYLENNVWVHRGYLPARYRGYDMYHGYKVVVNQSNPWLRHNYYHNTYATYRGRRNQAIIRDSRETRYREHWRGEGGGPGRDNGNHFGNRPGGGDRGHMGGGNPGHGPGGDHGHGPGGDHGHGGGEHGGHGRP